MAEITDIKDIQIPDIIPELERGPQWLRDIRKSSRDTYNKTPLPRRGLHLWRYTDPTKFTIDKSAIKDSQFDDMFDKLKNDEIKNLKNDYIAALATDKSGREIEFYETDIIQLHGIVIKKLSEAVESHYDIVNRYLYKLINSETGKFEAMNSALWNDGIFIYIPDGKIVETPIHLLRESGLANSAQFPRLLVVVGKNAEVSIIDEYGGGAVNGEGQSYTNAAVEIFGQQDSRTRYIFLQRQTNSSTVYLSHRAQVEQNATILTIPLSFGGAISKQNFRVTLNGRGADSKMYGLLFGTGRQHFDNHTLHHHAVGNTTSDIDFKVVLKDKANSAYTGLIKIEHNAKTCEAYQENRNLLLSKGCHAETIPELEILNEDVMCSHGATLGPIDPEMVFYLKCRGIEESVAVRMIVAGFVEGTMRQVPADIKERLTDYVIERLENL